MRISIEILLMTVAFVIGYFTSTLIQNPKGVEEITQTRIIERPLEKYAIENLANTTWKTGTFDITEILSEEDDYTSHLFRFRFVPEISGGNFKTTTGVMNLPKGGAEKFPLILLMRGYVDQKTYTSGMGSKNAAAYFSQNGFMTIAPDFLGYAGSDSEAGNIFESRFQTYVTAVSLLRSIEGGILEKYWDGKNILIWAHSNGGQVALVTLEVTGASYPTVLWAPVSKPFPYSVLYYTDESADRGKLIRSELSKFENLYDTEKYSPDNFYDKINAPIRIHQGTADDAVPLPWSNSLVTKLKSLGKDAVLIKHYGADHNLRPSWDTAIEQSLKFFVENKM